MLWEVDIYPRPGQADRAADAVVAEAADLGIAALSVTAARGYLIQGDLEQSAVERLARELLADQVVETTVVGRVGDDRLTAPPHGRSRLVHVLPKPGVMDPVAQSAVAAIRDFELEVDAVRTLKKYWLSELPDEALARLSTLR